LLQAGLFYKALSNPLVVNQEYVASGTYAGYLQTQPNNGGSAWVYGIELAYQQRLSFLPGMLGGLGFSGNYTYSDSQAKSVDPLRTDSPALLRQTPNTWNIGPSYDRGRVSVHLGLEYNGASIYSYQYEDLKPNPAGGTLPNPQVGGVAGPAGDNYLYPHMPGRIIRFGKSQSRRLRLEPATGVTRIHHERKGRPARMRQAAHRASCRRTSR